jgi:hypothetical protein
MRNENDRETLLAGLTNYIEHLGRLPDAKMVGGFVEDPTSPKISVFPMRRGELPVGSGKFLKIGLILVGSGRV